MLLKAYAEFPLGFRDHYSADYSGYQSAGDFSWESARGQPNGVPDILDEVKYATDYFIRCARGSARFYYQVGEGDKDHKNWVTSVKMATLSADQGGQPRTVFSNPAGSSMASFCAATLALMARVYRRFDAAYADRCLAHALYAYEYAKAHPGSAGAADGGYYPANARWEDDFVIMTTELYFTTQDTKYRDEAAQKAGQVGDHYWSLCYNNNDDLALYNLAVMGSANAKSRLNSIVNRYKSSVTSDGVGSTGSEWGILRYSAGQAFAAALNAKLQGAGLDPLVHNTVDYIMGGNAAGQSFIVGYGAKSPQHPHHRNVFLNDDNVADDAKNGLQIPSRNRQHGYMVGGSLDPHAFVDDINTYQYTEGGIDYNCGLVGALGAVVAALAPVDTSTVDGNLRRAVSARHCPVSRSILWLPTGARYYSQGGRGQADAIPPAGAVLTPAGRVLSAGAEHGPAARVFIGRRD
ncbi:MAG: hypothetical protein GF331_09510 [Chitinivibrionales bacterium]|nr:hypothetical protein [Chitinivibrionales bacterium]